MGERVPEVLRQILPEVPVDQLPRGLAPPGFDALSLDQSGLVLRLQGLQDQARLTCCRIKDRRLAVVRMHEPQRQILYPRLRARVRINPKPPLQFADDVLCDIAVVLDALTDLCNDVRRGRGGLAGFGRGPILQRFVDLREALDGIPGTLDLLAQLAEEREPGVGALQFLVHSLQGAYAVTFLVSIEQAPLSPSAALRE